MSLITSTPNRGRECHIYENEGDNKSLCGRAPFTGTQMGFILESVTCWKCKRAYDIFSRNRIIETKPAKRLRGNRK